VKDHLVASGEAEFSRHAVERLSLFSDAVAAIAITLLALDLPVPAGATVSVFWSSVRHSGSNYVAFLISFAFATKLLITRELETTSAHAVRLGFYALLQVASSILLLMQRHLASRGQAAATPSASIANLTWQSYGLILGFGLSIPLLFVWKWAWLLWIFVPLLFDRVSSRQRANFRA
jgi:hypothetical protein